MKPLKRSDAGGGRFHTRGAVCRLVPTFRVALSLACIGAANSLPALHRSTCLSSQSSRSV
ncbi:MAG: hypothetical protein JXB07_11925 [Anaerolineae bacterium]|nr:hypothetical protein [Anaerolineae bacterium]